MLKNDFCQPIYGLISHLRLNQIQWYKSVVYAQDGGENLSL